MHDYIIHISVHGFIYSATCSCLQDSHLQWASYISSLIMEIIERWLCTLQKYMMYYVGNVSFLFSAIKFMINSDILGQGGASWLKSLF